MADLGLRALISFDSAGRYAENRSLGTRWHGGRVLLQGDTLVMGINAPPEGPAPEGALWVEALVRAVGRDTLRLADVSPFERRSIRIPSCDMGFSGMPPIFSPDLRWTANGSRITAVTGAEYEVVTYEQDGEILKVRRSVRPEAGTAERARAQIGDAMRVRMPDGLRICDADEVVEQRGVAPSVPTIADIALEPDGSLWVRRRNVGTAPGPIDVFSPSGHYEGTLPADTPFPLAFFSDGRIVAAETDELDVTRAVVYRVVRD